MLFFFHLIRMHACHIGMVSLMHRLFANACAHFDNSKSMGWSTRFSHTVSLQHILVCVCVCWSARWLHGEFSVRFFSFWFFFLSFQFALWNNRHRNSSSVCIFVSLFRNAFVSVAQFPNPNSVANRTHTNILLLQSAALKLVVLVVCLTYRIDQQEKKIWNKNKKKRYAFCLYELFLCLV